MASGLDAVRRFALALPGASEEPHFERTSFRVGGKIFATADAEGTFLNVFVEQHEAEAAVANHPASFTVVFWGNRAKGVTADLATAPPDRLEELLLEAWRRWAPKRLVAELDARLKGRVD